jgi:hypothetical protein
MGRAAVCVFADEDGIRRIESLVHRLRAPAVRSKLAACHRQERRE